MIIATTSSIAMFAVGWLASQSVGDVGFLCTTKASSRYTAI